MVYETIRRLLAQQLDISEDRIQKDTNIVDDLGADSLDLAELLTTLEDELGILLMDDRIRELYTVGEVAEFIENLMTNN